MFKRNEGILDRIVRVILGLVLLPVGLFTLWGIHAIVVGIIMAGIGTIALVTGISGVCPSYYLFGFSTLEKEREFLTKFRSMASSCMPFSNAGTGRMCWPGTTPTDETQPPQP